MICPRCEKDTLDELNRDGITVDVCRECRGIWLDRGELERLIARAAREMEPAAASYGRSGEYHGENDHHSRSHDSRDHHDKHHDKHHSDDSHHGYGDSHHHRKKHWLAEIFD